MSNIISETFRKARELTTRSDEDRVQKTTEWVLNSRHIIPDSSVVLFSSIPAVVQEAPKSIEARRQMARLHVGRLAANPSAVKDLDKEYETANSMLSQFVMSGSDIPVASVDEDGNPSLFIKDGNVYVDLTFDGGNSEYYIKITGPTGIVEEGFEVEASDGKFLPPKLLGKIIAGRYHK